MTTSHGIVPHQRPSCSAATQAKAARLEVLNISRREAIIAGQHGDYIVSFTDLTCTCRAGQDGLHCSHVLRSLIERSRMHGYGDVDFYDDRLDAKVACVAHLKAGRKARTVEEHGYVYVETETPPPPKVTRRFATYDATTGDLAVWENGRVIGHCRTYPEMGEIHG